MMSKHMKIGLCLAILLLLHLREVSASTLARQCGAFGIVTYDMVASSVVNSAVEAAGFADEGVRAVIGGDAVKYSAFKSWAGSVPGGEDAVVANMNAAAAYLLGAEKLFENRPVIEIGEFEGASEGMTLSMTVKDGEDAVKCAAERVKDLFEATGDIDDWTGEAKLVPIVEPLTEGTSEILRFSIVPGDGTVPKAFLRVRVK